MKILILHAGYRVPAGEDTVVANEAAALESAGHHVVTHVVKNPTSVVATVGALARSAHNRAAASFVRREIDDFGPDIVHIHNTWFALSSAVVAAVAATGTPTVMTIHNYRLGCLSADLFRGDAVCTACVGRTPLPGVIHGCYRNSRLLSFVAATEVTVTRRRGTLIDNVDRFIAPSSFMADRLRDIGVPSDRLTVKPHFVADSGPRRNPPSASNEVLYIGRLADGKGLHTLLRAWERFQASERHPDTTDLTLSIIGDGPLASELREAAPRGVRFDGWVPRDEVMTRLTGARAFVFPSVWYEPFGMVLVEALSAGVAMVVTNASEAPVITAAPAELIAPVDDDALLAAAIGRLDDATVDRVGAANRERFESTYTEAIGIADLESLYAEVIGARRSREGGDR